MLTLPVALLSKEWSWEFLKRLRNDNTYARHRMNSINWDFMEQRVPSILCLLFQYGSHALRMIIKVLKKLRNSNTYRLLKIKIIKRNSNICAKNNWKVMLTPPVRKALLPKEWSGEFLKKLKNDNTYARLRMKSINCDFLEQRVPRILRLLFQ